MIDVNIKITALAIEARKRKCTYGYLMAHTTPEERKQIIRAYLASK